MFVLARYVNKFLGRLKKFGPAQNIFGPVTGQGIRSLITDKSLRTETEADTEAAKSFV